MVGMRMDDIDFWVDMLIGGELTPMQREAVLQRLLHDAAARSQLAENLRQRRELREAFGRGDGASWHVGAKRSVPRCGGPRSRG